MDNSLSLDALRLFALLAQCRSFSAAAKLADVSRAHVSKRVAEVERALGTKLFHRTTRSVSLTPAGELFVAFAGRAVEDAEQTDRAMRELRSEPSGLLRLTAPNYWGERYLAKWLPEYVALHPQVEIELVLADQRLDLVAEKFDMAIRLTSEVEPDLVSTTLTKPRRYVVASAVYLARAGTPAEPQDLTNHMALASWIGGAYQPWRLRRGDEEVSVLVKSRYRTNGPGAVREAVVAGLGVGILPDYVCDDDLHSGCLTHVLPDWKPVTFLGDYLLAAGLPERIRLPRCRSLIQFLREKLAVEAAPQ